MFYREQFGIKFNFKNDWKALFQKDTWFEWQRRYDSDSVVLKRFTLWNVAIWCFYRLIIKIVAQLFVPVIRLAEKYWYDFGEGQICRVIPNRILHQGIEIKFFKLGEEK